MTLATFISPADFDVLVDTAFQAETPQVLSSESAPGATLEHFADAAALKARAAQCIADGVHHFAFGLWYPSMKGAYAERRVVLEPPRAGHDFLHSLAGWGLIHLHLYVTPPATLQCRVAVNSEARAAARQDRYPELGPVSDWDWRRIESLAYGLTRRLGTMGATGPVGQPRAAEVPAADAASPVRSPKAQNSGKAESPGSPKNSADPKSPWDDAVRRRRS